MQSTKYDRLATQILIVAFFAMYFSFFAGFTTVGEHPDETGHLTYIRDVVSGRFFPDYTTNATGTYLNHPALYYSLTGWTARLLSLFGVSVERSVLVVNFALGIMTTLLIYRFARLLSPNYLGAVIGTLCALTVPFFSYLLTGANNDNLSNLMFIAVVVFSCQFLISRDPFYFIIASGLTVLTLLAKTTAFVQSAAFLLPSLVLILRQSSVKELVRMSLNWFVVTSLTLVFAYFAYIFLRYGKLFPSPIDFMETAMVSSPKAFGARPMGLIEYVAKFFKTTALQSSGIYSHVIYRYTDKPLSFWSLAYVSGLAIFLWTAIKGENPQRLICVSFLLSLVAFAFAHVGHLYRIQLANHYLGGLQFRYYLPFCVLAISGAISLLFRMKVSERALVCGGIFLLAAFMWHDARLFMLRDFLASRGQ